MLRILLIQVLLIGEVYAVTTPCQPLNDAAAAVDEFATREIDFAQSAPSRAPFDALPRTFEAAEGRPLRETDHFRVLRGTHFHMGQPSPVAIRQARPTEVRTGPSPRSRIQTEARHLRKIAGGSHPGKARVAQLVESGADYVATRWQNGRTLYEILSSGKLTSAEAVRLLAQVREGIAAIHDAGIVHGDITPKNILVSDSGNVTILDLGISVRLGERHVSQGSVETASENQTRLGTAELADDLHAFNVVSALVREKVEDASFSLEPFRRLVAHLGVERTNDPRDFYQRIATRFKHGKHMVPPELRADVVALNEKLGHWFSDATRISSEDLASPKQRFGTLPIALPRELDSHVPDKDAKGFPREAIKRGSVAWTLPSGQILTTDVQVEGPLSVAAIAKGKSPSPSLAARIGDIPPASKITTVVTRTYRDGDRTVAKAELHLVEDAAGNQTLVIDKVFNDISELSDGTSLSGTFLFLQAANSFPNLHPGKLRRVQVWETVNADTVIAMHEKRVKGEGANEGERYRGTLMDGYTRAMMKQLGVKPTGNPEVRGGAEEPLAKLAPDLPSAASTGGINAFTFELPDTGPTIRYSYTGDSYYRRRRNGELLDRYRDRSGNPKVRELEAFSRFDVEYAVSPP